MNIQDLLLTKEELPILNGLSVVPIHPRLLESRVRLDKQLANQVFPQAAKEWYDDLKAYSDNCEDNTTKDWIDSVFLEQPLKLINRGDKQEIANCYWEDGVETLDNGFASSLIIVPGDPIFLYLDQSQPFTLFPKDRALIFNPTQMTEEKLKEFTIQKINVYEGDKSYPTQIYQQHGVDSYPQALFLRNWAILYLNAAMKQVLKPSFKTSSHLF